MTDPSPRNLPKPRTLLGWGLIAAATAFVKEKYTDLSWGDVARAPIQGILDAYNDTKTSGWTKAWNVAVETTKLGVGIGLMAGATALATAAAPAVAATVAGGVAIAAGGLIVGGVVSHFVVEPLLDKAKLKSEPASPRSQQVEPVPTNAYASLANHHGVHTAAEPEALAPASTTRHHQIPNATMALPKITA